MRLMSGLAAECVLNGSNLLVEQTFDTRRRVYELSRFAELLVETRRS